MIVQMPDESQLKSRTNLETEETVGELSHRVAQGSWICSAIAVSAIFRQWADVWHELWLYIPVPTSL